MIVATIPKSEHPMACHCEACKQYVTGLRTQCAHCKRLFRSSEITYREGDFGYNPLCNACWELPVFLPYWDRMRLSLVSDEEIANWNARHDW